MSVAQRKHEPPDFVSDVKIPAAFKAMQRFERDAHANKDE